MDKELGMLLTVIITIIVGIALLMSISNSINLNRTLGTVTNESISITENTWTSLAYDDLIAVSALRNMTSGTAIGSGNYTGDNIDLANGRIFANNTGSGNGVYGIDYTFYPNTYVKESTSRELLPLILIFFVLGLIAFCVWWIRKTGFFGGL